MNPLLNNDLIANLNFVISELIALAWVLHVPFIIVWGYYMRDRSHDDDTQSTTS